ncbi:MAG: GNAT family N-acetyltransferase [bacterium]
MIAMHFDVEFYREEHRADWERFIRRAVQGNIFSMQRFFDYHPKGRFQHRHLIFRRKGHIVAVWPGAYRDEDGKKSWTSHPGASYGGLLIRDDISLVNVHRLLTDLIEVAKKEGIERLRCTPPPLLYHRKESDTVEFAMRRAGFKYLRQDLTQAVDLRMLPRSERQVIAMYDAKTRTAIRKAEREGVSIRHNLPLEGETLDQYYHILFENRKKLDVTPTHTRDELEKLSTLAPKQLEMSMAYYDSEPIAGILNFICNEKVMLEFYIAHRDDAQHLRPSPLLVHDSIIHALDRGFTWYDFGISTEPGNKVTWGLAAFKENFSMQAFFRNTLVLDGVQKWKAPANFMPPSHDVDVDVR